MDNEEEVFTEFPKVDSIYGEAYITVATSITENDHRGLYCARLQCIESISRVKADTLIKQLLDPR
jgi:hypothetical protein